MSVYSRERPSFLTIFLPQVFRTGKKTVMNTPSLASSPLKAANVTPKINEEDNKHGSFNVYAYLDVFLGILAIFFNLFVLLAIYAEKKLRTITNCFVGSLALSDVLVGIISIPISILSRQDLPKDFTMCLLLYSADVSLENISVLNLLTVALERFCAIRFPFHYRSWTIKRALIVVVLSWLLAFMLGTLPLMGWNKGEENFKKCSFLSVISIQYMVYLIFMAFHLPAIMVIILSYVYIFIVVRRTRRAISGLKIISGKEQFDKSVKTSLRGDIGILMVLVMFLIAWTPFYINNFVILAQGDHTIVEREHIFYALDVLSHINSVVNPFLFAFGYSQFKVTIKHILFGKCKREGTHREGNKKGEFPPKRESLQPSDSKSVLLLGIPVKFAPSSSMDIEQMVNKIRLHPFSNSKADARRWKEIQLAAGAASRFMMPLSKYEGPTEPQSKRASVLHIMLRAQVQGLADDETLFSEIGHSSSSGASFTSSALDTTTGTDSIWTNFFSFNHSDRKTSKDTSTDRMTSKDTSTDRKTSKDTSADRKTPKDTSTDRKTSKDTSTDRQTSKDSSTDRKTSKDTYTDRKTSKDEQKAHDTSQRRKTSKGDQTAGNSSAGRKNSKRCQKSSLKDRNAADRKTSRGKKKSVTIETPRPSLKTEHSVDKEPSPEQRTSNGSNRAGDKTSAKGQASKDSNFASERTCVDQNSFKNSNRADDALFAEPKTSTKSPIIAEKIFLGSTAEKDGNKADCLASSSKTVVKQGECGAETKSLQAPVKAGDTASSSNESKSGTGFYDFFKFMKPGHKPTL